MRINIGVIGFGPRAQGLLKSAPGRFTIKAGFDPSEASQKKMTDSNIKIVDAYNDLFNIPDIQGIIIGSPPQFHAEQAIAALESGIHVFSEVPMAIKKEDIQKIIDADESNPKAIYMLGENTCYHAEVLYASYLVESGKIGPTVYCETEYLHDVSYRWRGKTDDYKHTPVKSHWYSQFDPLMYAHAIGPAQVAMGGLKKPMPFVEAMSYGNSIGGDDSREKPVCSPAHCFQVSLFKSKTGAIAKCASGYVFAREPSRYICLLTGRYGTYESYAKGKKGRLFLADGFNINLQNHRKGNVLKVNKRELSKACNLLNPFGENQRVINEWYDAIQENRRPVLDSKWAANVTMSGIAASESSRTGKIVSIPLFE